MAKMRVDEQFVFDWIEQTGGMEEIEQAVQLIMEYRITPWYESKQALINQWEIDHKSVYDIIIAVFTTCLVNESVTYQSMVGMLNHKIKVEDELGRIKIMADVIGLIINTGLIDIHSQTGEYHMLNTAYELDAEIPVEDRHETVTLRPQPVESNRTDRGSILLGHTMNHHEGYGRLSHINIMNNIALKLNQEFISIYEEAPKYEPETVEEELQAAHFIEVSTEKYEELGNSKFYNLHNYCTRGRTYSGSYYLSYQGTSYKKAIIELVQTEIVEGF